MKRIITILTFAIALFIVGWSYSFSALAITQNYQWQGNKGYTVKATFSYDESDSPSIIAEKGAGQTKQLKSLTVTFYNPAGKIIDTYNNVQDSISQGNYFQLNFDPQQKQLLGDFDLGGEVPGDLYLKGKINRHLSLIQVESSGEETIIDRD